MTTVRNKTVKWRFQSLGHEYSMLLANAKLDKTDVFQISQLTHYRSLLLEEALDECPHASVFYVDIVPHEKDSTLCWLEVYVPKSVYFLTTYGV